MLTFLGLVGLALLGWSVVGFRNPRRARLPNRWLSIPIGFVSICILNVVGGLMDAEKEEVQKAEAVQRGEVTAVAPVETPEEAEARKRREEAGRDAKKRQEDADRIVKARKKLLDNGRIFAGVYCANLVEARAKFSFRWINGFLEHKFSVGQWQKETDTEKIVLYMGNKIEIQNRFGAWRPHLYECLVDVKNEKILSVNVVPRS